MSADKPILVEAITDPEVPPLPPHIRFEHAKNYVAALLAGDPHGWRALKQSVKDMTSGWPGRKS